MGFECNGLFSSVIISVQAMRVPHIAKAASIGAGSLATLAIVAVFSLVFRVLLSAAFFGQWPVAFIIVAYLLFSPAVGCALYSLLFERPKAPALAALALGLFTIFLAGILLDGLLILPFWFLAAVGLSKLLSRRGGKIAANTSDPGF
jgi:hypothetical protein